MAADLVPGNVIAVVLTFRRERLASQVVRGLIREERFAPHDIVVVVNGEGGLDDCVLEQQVRVVHLPENVGPAGGFRAGLEEAYRCGAKWAYLCEDDIGLFDLPTPRVAPLLERVEGLPRTLAESIGGIVAYGRMLDSRTGRTRPALPRQLDRDFAEVDVAAWGASLVRCDVVGRGILPDSEMFFGYEDFDFWLAMQAAGYRLLLDVPTASKVAERVFHERREVALKSQRPTDAEEPWRRYYEARNFLALRRRYGHVGWSLSHILMTLRRAQLSPTWAHRWAGIHGLYDGLRARTGRNDRYLRNRGERPSSRQPRVLQVITDNDRRGGQVFATDLEGALVRRELDLRTVALAPAENANGLPHQVLGPSRRHLRTLLSLRKEMRDADVVVGHGSTTLPMCSLAGIGLPTRFVYRQISDQLFWANTPFRRLRTRLALNRTDKVVALWQGAADVLTDTFGVESSSISVIPNGVPASRCPAIDEDMRSAARRRFALEDDVPVLLSIGALVPEKGVDILVRAIQSPNLEGWRLLIVGAGPEEDRLRRLASRGPVERVAFHGPVASGAEAMAAADVVGLTSRGGDSMPAVLIEAGMMGIPAVATPIEGIVDIISDGVTGRLVPADDASATAQAIAEVGSERARFGATARGYCLRRFEIDQVAAAWHGVLTEVING